MDISHTVMLTGFQQYSFFTIFRLMQVVSYNHNNNQDLAVVLKKLADKVANGLNLDGMVTHTFVHERYE